jgi:hypothetical protein
MKKSRDALIEVPQYTVGFGMDIKFAEDVNQSGGPFN